MGHELHSATLMSRAGHRQRESGRCSASLPIIWPWSNTQILIPVPFSDYGFKCITLSTKAVQTLINMP